MISRMILWIYEMLGRYKRTQSRLNERHTVHNQCTTVRQVYNKKKIECYKIHLPQTTIFNRNYNITCVQYAKNTGNNCCSSMFVYVCLFLSFSALPVCMAIFQGHHRQCFFFIHLAESNEKDKMSGEQRQFRQLIKKNG